MEWSVGYSRSMALYHGQARLTATRSYVHAMAYPSAAAKRWGPMVVCQCWHLRAVTG